jgi:hypothetical protein
MMFGQMFILAYGVSRPRSTMLFLKRLLILFSLVLFSAHGAFAHVAFAHSEWYSEWSSEHAAQMSGMVMETSSAANVNVSPSASGAPAHCLAYSHGLVVPDHPCRHEHCPCCCVATCGIHCGALFIAFQFEPRVPGSTLPPPLPEQRRDGLTHAPPVRPPIG